MAKTPKKPPVTFVRYTGKTAVYLGDELLLTADSPNAEFVLEKMGHRVTRVDADWKDMPGCDGHTYAPAPAKLAPLLKHLRQVSLARQADTIKRLETTLKELKERHARGEVRT